MGDIMLSIRIDGSDVPMQRVRMVRGQPLIVFHYMRNDYGLTRRQINEVATWTCDGQTLTPTMYYDGREIPKPEPKPEEPADTRIIGNSVSMIIERKKVNESKLKNNKRKDREHENTTV